MNAHVVGQPKIKHHDTWLVSPRLYSAINSTIDHDAPQDVPKFRSNVGALRCWGVSVVPEPMLSENRIALMLGNILVQMIEVEWGGDDCQPAHG